MRPSELNLTIDHVSLSVDDLERAKNFYSKTLAPVGLVLVAEVSAEQSGSVAMLGFGIGRKDVFRPLGPRLPPQLRGFRRQSTPWLP